MPDFLLELFSEEIPARMQGQAADDLRRLVSEALHAQGLSFEGAASFATPRRLALHIAGLPERQEDRSEVKKGPRVGAPDAAIQGFVKSAGLASIKDAKIEVEPKKGEFYVAVVEHKGRGTAELLAEILPDILNGFPWPKSMRWGADSASPEALRWIRPLHSIVATFGPETEEPEIVDFALDGIKASDRTHGHRFMAPAEIRVRRFDDYVSSLEKAKVVLDAERRRDIILFDAQSLAYAQGLELVVDTGLLEEVAGLVEWPVVLVGEFDEDLLAIPPEVIRATIRANQKCFVLRNPETGGLANKFILTANIVAPDDGAAIAAGNGRVVRARLSDAKFFYETDLHVNLEDRLPKFDSIVFHEKLGTQAERIARIERLATEIAPLVGAVVEKAKRAAKLCKADLLTEVVGEFPELQGLMGKYYAEAQGEDKAVANAIEDHYKPKGPSDLVPSDPVAIAVALADKLDTLACFWAIDERPTGSKDPYALRRAALGVIRIIVDNKIRLRLRAFGRQVFDYLHMLGGGIGDPFYADEYRQKAVTDLLAFFADRLKVQLREQGARYDLVDAVFALEGQDDLLLIVRRVEALGRFLDTDDGTNLLVGYRRAANILRAEEKKAGEKEAATYQDAFSPQIFVMDEERTLAAALLAAATSAIHAVADENFEAAMQALSSLRGPVDAFFDKVTVNADDKALRLNRLRLLNGLRAAVHQVADFSKIAG